MKDQKDRRRGGEDKIERMGLFKMKTLYGGEGERVCACVRCVRVRQRVRERDIGRDRDRRERDTQETETETEKVTAATMAKRSSNYAFCTANEQATKRVSKAGPGKGGSRGVPKQRGMSTTTEETKAGGGGGRGSRGGERSVAPRASECQLGAQWKQLRRRL